MTTRALTAALVALMATSAGTAREADASRPGRREGASRRPRPLKRVQRPRPRAIARLRRGRPPLARARMRRTLPRADHGAGIRQVTGRDLAVGQQRFAFRSPADPYVYETPEGRVQVYGTFENVLEFDSLDDFLRGGAFRVQRIPTTDDFTNERSWDQMVFRWHDGTEVLYGGAMTATGERAESRWPDDNWNRRIYAFTRDAQGRWVRRAAPLFNPIPATPTMIGHAYGHHLQTYRRRVGGRAVTETWLFHEEVVAEHPLRTELFARRMIDPFTASAEKVKLLGTEWDGQAIGQRTGGDLLVEGPRPFSATLGGQPYHFVSFSSGDFNSDNYDIHFAWRKGDPIGPYTPYVDRGAGGTVTLRGFGAHLKQRYGLSWLGRAQVIQDRGGRFWAVFHAVDTSIRPETDYGAPSGPLETYQRNIYAVPMTIEPGAGGEPRITLHDLPRGGRTR